MSILDCSVVHISISSELVEAVRLITKIDFYDTQCLPGCQAKTMARKLRNFIDVRNVEEYTKFMQYYGLHSLAVSNGPMGHFAEQLIDAETKGCGVVISIEA